MIKQTLRTSLFTLVAATTMIPVAQAAPTVYGKAYVTPAVNSVQLNLGDFSYAA